MYQVWFAQKQERFGKVNLNCVTFNARNCQEVCKVLVITDVVLATFYMFLTDFV